MDRQTYKIKLDMMTLPFAEHVKHECDDGVVRQGIFIPYEENNVYYNEDHATMFMIAVPNTNNFRRNGSPANVNNTHAIHPYWTRAHRAKMMELGIDNFTRYLGNMAIDDFRNYIKAPLADGRDRRPHRKKKWELEQEKEITKADAIRMRNRKKKEE